ncbi:MAG: hypothetical protein ABIK85_07265 [Candidatus Eisenbacteria bacterium]
MIRNMLAAVLVIALAMTAGAFDIRTYDVLYTGDTGATLDAGGFGIQGSFLYFSADKYYDRDGESQEWGEGTTFSGTWVPVKISYGIMDGFEVGVTPMFVMNKQENGPPLNTEYEGTGIADTWIWAKYGILPDPMMTARLGVKVPTGVDEMDADPDELPTGSGQMDIDAAVMFGAPAGPGSLDGSIGYRYRMDRTGDEDAREGDYTPGNEIHFYAGYNYFLSDVMSLRLGAGGFFGSDPEEDGEPIPVGMTGTYVVGSNLVSINPGFDYIMDSGMSLGFDMYYPLMGTNINAGWGLGLSVGWGN